MLLNGRVAAVTETGFTEADLLEAAGQRSFERGLAYLRAVDELAILGNRVTASVRGTDDYIVILTLSGDRGVTGVCDCPYGQEGFFCKHCVAVGLTFLRRAGSGPAVTAVAATAVAATAVPAQRAPAGDYAETDGRGPGQAQAAGLHSWLNSLSRDDLLLLVLDQLVDDEDWRHRLELRAAAADADIDVIVARLLDLLDPAEFGAYGYVEEDESRRYANRVEAAADVVDGLVDSDHADEAVAVAEYAVDLVAGACRYAADPAGAIWAAAADLMASHQAACLAAEPDPDELAAFIAGRMLSGDDMPAIDIAGYRDALGETGAARLRELLMVALDDGPSGRTERALEDFLRAIGDVDALVAVLAANLPPTGLGHLRIAEELELAGRRDDALDWAERGLRATAGPPQPLTDFVAGRYVELGRVGDALTVRRDSFAAARDAQAFAQLRAIADGTESWPATKAWALELLRADADAARLGQRGLRLAAESVLIDVLISEGDTDSAWEAAAGLASEDQWRRLANLIAPARPADALGVYLRQIEPLRHETGDKAYERIAALLLRARDCHRRLGTEAAFNVYLRVLRAEQKRKRKLLAILDSHQL